MTLARNAGTALLMMSAVVLAPLIAVVIEGWLFGVVVLVHVIGKGL